MQNIFLGPSLTGNKLKNAIIEGDCSVNFKEMIIPLEWKNQIKDRRTYFHTFPYDGMNHYVSSMQLRSDPYRAIFRRKMSHMEENGMMERLFMQLKPMKAVESEELKPLKLEHFYLVFLGICVGLVASATAFLCEILVHK